MVFCFGGSWFGFFFLCFFFLFCLGFIVCLVFVSSEKLRFFYSSVEKIDGLTSQCINGSEDVTGSSSSAIRS